MKELVNELIITYSKYITLLGKEHNETAGIARVHGWKSKQENIDEGIKLREKIEKLKSEIYGNNFHERAKTSTTLDNINKILGKLEAHYTGGFTIACTIFISSEMRDIIKEEVGKSVCGIMGIYGHYEIVVDDEKVSRIEIHDLHDDIKITSLIEW